MCAWLWRVGSNVAQNVLNNNPASFHESVTSGAWLWRVGSKNTTVLKTPFRSENVREMAADKLHHQAGMGRGHPPSKRYKTMFENEGVARQAHRSDGGIQAEPRYNDAVQNVL